MPGGLLATRQWQHQRDLRRIVEPDAEFGQDFFGDQRIRRVRRIATAPVGEIVVRCERIACRDQSCAAEVEPAGERSRWRPAVRVKSALAAALRCRPSQISRWLSRRSSCAREAMRSRSSAVADARCRPIQRELRARPQRENVRDIRRAAAAAECGRVRRALRSGRCARSASSAAICARNAKSALGSVGLTCFEQCARLVGVIASQIFARSAQQAAIAQFAGRLCGERLVRLRRSAMIAVARQFFGLVDTVARSWLRRGGCTGVMHPVSERMTANRLMSAHASRPSESTRHLAVLQRHVSRRHRGVSWTVGRH